MPKAPFPEYREFVMQEEHRRAVWRGLIAMLGAVSVIGASVGVFVTIRDSGVTLERLKASAAEAARDRREKEQQRAEISQQAEEIARLQKSNEGLQTALSSAQQNRAGPRPAFAVLSPDDRQSISRTSVLADQLQVRLSVLESALMNTPEKSLALPMLRQQVDTLQDRTRGTSMRFGRRSSACSQ